MRTRREKVGRPIKTFKDETGNCYGTLRVLRFYGSTKQGAAWLCRCDPERGGCGTEVAVLGVKLRNGNTRSCGCLRDMSVSDRYALGYFPHGKERDVVA